MERSGGVGLVRRRHLAQGVDVAGSRGRDDESTRQVDGGGHRTSARALVERHGRLVGADLPEGLAVELARRVEVDGELGLAEVVVRVVRVDHDELTIGRVDEDARQGVVGDELEARVALVRAEVLDAVEDLVELDGRVEDDGHDETTLIEVGLGVVRDALVQRRDLTGETADLTRLGSCEHGWISDPFPGCSNLKQGLLHLLS